MACKLVMSLPTFTIASSIFTMVAISFDRYFSIVHQKNIDRKKALIIIVLIWVISIATTAPQMYEYSIYQKNETEPNGEFEIEIACGSHGIAENFETIYASIVVAVCYLGPLLLMSVNYVNVGKFLWSAGGGAVNGTVSKQRVRIVQMLASVSVVFALLWLPYFTLFTMEVINCCDFVRLVPLLSYYNCVNAKVVHWRHL